LNLKRELYGPVSKLQILGFQTLKQVSVVAAVAVGSRDSLAGPRKLENQSGFFPISQVGASCCAH
jgi:hypothetical protein